MAFLHPASTTPVEVQSPWAELRVTPYDVDALGNRCRPLFPPRVRGLRGPTGGSRSDRHRVPRNVVGPTPARTGGRYTDLPVALWRENDRQSAPPPGRARRRDSRSTSLRLPGRLAVALAQNGVVGFRARLALANSESWGSVSRVAALRRGVGDRVRVALGPTLGVPSLGAPPYRAWLPGFGPTHQAVCPPAPAPRSIKSAPQCRPGPDRASRAKGAPSRAPGSGVHSPRLALPEPGPTAAPVWCPRPLRPTPPTTDCFPES